VQCRLRTAHGTGLGHGIEPSDTGAPVDAGTTYDDAAARRPPLTAQELKAFGQGCLQLARRPREARARLVATAAQLQAWTRRLAKAGYSLYRTYDDEYLVLDAHRQDVARLRKPLGQDRYTVTQRDQVVGLLERRGDDWQIRLEQAAAVDPRVLMIVASLKAEELKEARRPRADASSS
jgi:hypothetical protein